MPIDLHHLILQVAREHLVDRADVACGPQISRISKDGFNRRVESICENLSNLWIFSSFVLRLRPPMPDCVFLRLAAPGLPPSRDG
jgi:hypothetical protein